MKMKHLLGLPLATSQRLARLRFLVLLMVLLVLMVVIVVMVIVVLGRSVDNPQTRVVGLQRGRAAAVFLHLMVNIGRFMVGVVVAKLSRALVDDVEGRCLLLVVDCSRLVDRVVVRLSLEVHRALHVLQLGRGRQDGNQQQKRPHFHTSPKDQADCKLVN